MKKFLIIFFLTFYFAFISMATFAQCSICAKTVQQMGEGPAKGFNSGIIYLMLAPFAIIGYIGYRWWKGNASAK